MCGQIEKNTTKTEGRSRLAVFVSGSGSNLQVLIDACRSGELNAEVGLVVADNETCFALTRAKEAHIPSVVINRSVIRKMSEEERRLAHELLVSRLKEEKIAWVILAGYLSVIPRALVEAYPKRIVNVHPALIPKYSGKGFYGMRVHEAVIEAGEAESGITIHYVDDGIDTGEIIFQATCSVSGEDTPESLANKVHQLEHQYFKKIIGQLVDGASN